MSTSKKITYSEFSNKRTQSELWNHFLRANDGQSAKCRLCMKILKTGGGATTALHTHLRAVHNINNQTTENETSSNTANTSTASTSTSAASNNAPVLTKKIKMTDFFPSEDTRDIVISRMAALDGLSYKLFCTSEDLRRLFKKSGYVLPDSPATVSSIVVKHAYLVKKSMIKQISELKAAGHAFAITLDEWTSLRMKRYMNVNLHNAAFGGFGFKNLGLVKINGSMPAEAALKLLSDHLLTLEIVLQEDVVSLTTDGASVMIKMGRYFQGFHQLCLAHCIQLAVIDTFYKIQEVQEVPVHIENEETYDSDYEDQNEDGHDDRFEIEISSVQAEPIGHFKDLIEKVRNLVRSFRNSTLKRDALQTYVKKELGLQQELQLDCRTRWSTMSDMIGVFLKLKDSILKVMIDMKLNFPFSQREIDCLKEIHSSLEVVKITVNALCRREATLLTADTALRFMLKKIEENTDSLSMNLANNLRKRIKERRLAKIIGTLHYLHDCEDFFSSEEDDTFRKPTNEQISETIVDVLKRLKYRVNLPSTSSTESPMETYEPELHLSVAEQLEQELSKLKNKKQSTSFANLDLDGFVRVEKAIYDNGGCRGKYLSEAYHCLLCVLPTSVESERAFSAAGFFCTKLRSSLSDSSLNALSFLKTYYQELRSQKK